jgi:hypothetical protein
MKFLESAVDGRIDPRRIRSIRRAPRDVRSPAGYIGLTGVFGVIRARRSDLTIICGE